MFAAAVWVLVWATAQFIAPAILASTPVKSLRSGIQLITTLMVLCSLSAGLAGGMLGGWQARRARPDRLRFVFANALAGPVVAAVALVGVAWVRHQATPLRGTAINLTLVVLGAAAGGIVIARPPRPSGSRRVRLGLVGGLVILVVLMVSPTAPGAQTGGQYNDIEASGCTLSTEEGTASASLTLVGIEVGGQFAFSEQHTADGHWKVSVTDGAVGGFALSVGGKLAKAVGLSVEAGGHLTLSEINQYPLTSKVQADRMVRWAVGPYLSTVAALPGVGALVTPGLDPRMSSSGFSPPAPTATELKLEGSVHVAITALSLEGEIALGSAVSVELENVHNSNPNVVSDPEKVKIGLDLKPLLSGSFVGTSLDLTGDGELALGLKKASPLGINIWTPDSLEFDATAVGAATARLGGKLDTIPALGATRLAFGLAPTARLSAVLALAVDDLPSHPNTLAALGEFAGAIAPAFANRSVDEASLRRASNNLLESFAVEADATLTENAGTAVNPNLNLSVGEGLKLVGVKADIEASAERLVAAQYRTGPDTWAASNTCLSKEAAML